MIYRRTDLVPDGLLAESELRNLAAIGRLRRDADARRQAARAARERAKQTRNRRRAARKRARAEQRRRLRSTVRGSWLASPLVALWLGLTGAMLVPFCLLAGPVFLWIGLALIALPLAAVIAVPLVGRRRLAGERAWIDGLPFAVRGHWEALGASAHQRTARLAFTGARPARDLVADLLAATGAGSLSDDEAVIAITICGTGDFHDSNAAYRRELHRLIDEVALRLHDLYPIRSVVVEG